MFAVFDSNTVWFRSYRHSIRFRLVSFRFVRFRVEKKAASLHREDRKMPFSDYLRRRTLVHHSGGLSARAIVDALTDDGPSDRTLSPTKDLAQPDKESPRSLTRARL